MGLHYTDITTGKTEQHPNGCLLWAVRGNWPATGCRINCQLYILTAVYSRHRGILSLACSLDVAVETMLLSLGILIDLTNVVKSDLPGFVVGR